MSLATNIVRRSGSSRYYVRQRVPVDLVATYGKAEIWRSLGTSDQREAKRLARIALDELDREFEAKRLAGTFSERDVQEAVWRRYVELVEADENSRQIGELSEAELDEIWNVLQREFGDDDLGAHRALEYIRDRFDIEQRERPARIAALRAGVARGDIQTVRRDVADAVKATGKALPSGSDRFKKLAHGFQRAELEALARAEEREAGDYSGTPRDRLIQPPTAPAAPSPAETIMGQFDTYAKANPNGIKPDTLDYSRKCVATFAESLPSDFPASRIDKKAVRDWHDLLREFPVKAAEIREFKGKPIRDVVELNRTLGKATISKQTINKYLSALGSFCNWLVKRGVIDANPTIGMHDKLDKDARPVRSYTPEELTAIFASPIFTGFLSDDKDHLPGNQHTDDWRRWLPLLALFTGARLGELAQLLTADVREMHGRMVIFVTKEGDPAKSIKTRSSQRIIPVHPELAKLGFLAFHARAVENGQARLFPEIEPDARGHISGMPSGWYRRYVKRIGVKEDRAINFHSYRHGLTDACRRAGYLDAEFNFILGHADQKTATTRGYGSIPEGSLARRVEIIEAVTFPGLDLSHLYPAKT